MSFTPAEFEILKQNQARALGALYVPPTVKPKSIRRRGVPNPNEAAYGEHLELRRIVGEILGYAFEPDRFKIAEGAYWTPDWRIDENDLTFTYVDVKAWYRNQKRIGVTQWAQLAIKCASTQYPQHRWCQSYRDELGDWKHKFYGAKV